MPATNAQRQQQLVKAKAARLRELRGGKTRSDYLLGRELEELTISGLWHSADWPTAPEGGYPHTRVGYIEWCWAEAGCSRRKVEHLRRNWRVVNELGLDEAGGAFGRLMTLGWTKLSHVVRAVAADPESLELWLDVAEGRRKPDGTEGDGRPVSENSLKLAVKEALAEPEDDPAPSGASGSSSSGEAPTGEPPAERIDPETGEPLAPPSGEDESGPRVEWPLTFRNAEAARTFIRALDVCKARTNTDSNGAAAARIATYYMGCVPRDDEGGLVVELDEIIAAVESFYGVRLAIVSSESLGSAPAPQSSPEELVGATTGAELEGFE